MPTERGRLARTMRLPHAVAMVIGIIVGATIFVQPSEVSRAVPSFAGMLAVWAVAGALTWFGASVCAELSSAFPESGGVYVFLRELFSPAVGFMWGWAMFWSMHSGIIAAIAMVFARYLGAIVPMSDATMKGVAAGGILALSAVNYVGVKPGAIVQTALTALKLAAIGALLVLLYAASVPHVPLAHGAVTGAGFFRALVAGLFAFGGWHMVTYAADETRDAARTIPRALMLGTATVVVIYLALNAAYLRVLPLERVLASTRVAADAALVASGPRTAGAIALLVIVSAFGAMNGIILAGPRVYYAMAKDGLIFGAMGAVHPRFQTPSTAIVAQGLWSALLVLTGSYRTLFTRVVYTEWIFFGALAVGLLHVRRSARYTPAFHAWGGPVAPLLFAAMCLAIVVSQVIADPVESGWGLALVAAGLPVYYAWTATHARSRGPRPGTLEERAHAHR